MLACILLASCGFHLRGKFEYADAINPVFVISEDRDFIYELEEVFDFSDLPVADTAASANAILEFTSEIYERTPTTLDDRGRATRFRLRFTKRYRDLNSNGDALLTVATATTSRILDFDSSQVLQANREEQFLKEEMYSDLSQAVARRLARVSGEVLVSAEELKKYDELRRETEKVDAGG